MTVKTLLKVLLAVACYPLAAAAGQAPVTAETVAPVVLMRSGDIAACGLTASASVNGGAAVASLTLLKDSGTAPGTRFVLHGLWTGPSATPRRVSDLTLKTASQDTASSFSKPAPDDDGAFETTAVLPGLDGANLFRELMLGGGTIEMHEEDDGGDTLTLLIPGPVTPSVRAAYLNCAGDLFWPEP